MEEQKHVMQFETTLQHIKTIIVYSGSNNTKDVAKLQGPPYWAGTTVPEE